MVRALFPGCGHSFRSSLTDPVSADHRHRDRCLLHPLQRRRHRPVSHTGRTSVRRGPPHPRLAEDGDGGERGCLQLVPGPTGDLVAPDVVVRPGVLLHPRRFVFFWIVRPDYHQWPWLLGDPRAVVQRASLCRYADRLLPLSRSRTLTVFSPAVASVLTVIIAIASDRTKIRGPWMVLVLPLSVAGYAILITSKSNSVGRFPDSPPFARVRPDSRYAQVRYGALFLVASGLYSSVPPVLVWLRYESAGRGSQGSPCLITSAAPL